MGKTFPLKYWGIAVYNCLYWNEKCQNIFAGVATGVEIFPKKIDFSSGSCYYNHGDYDSTDIFIYCPSRLR